MLVALSRGGCCREVKISVYWGSARMKMWLLQRVSTVVVTSGSEEHFFS